MNCRLTQIPKISFYKISYLLQRYPGVMCFEVWTLQHLTYFFRRQPPVVLGLCPRAETQQIGADVFIKSTDCRESEVNPK